MILLLVAPTVLVVVVLLVAAERETRVGPLAAAPGPGRRDRRPVAPVLPLEPYRVELELVKRGRETPVEIRRADA